ncbi:MAG: type II toxin-antitoxin system RelE/ParE family toxin [Bacteroidota bacterium]
MAKKLVVWTQTAAKQRREILKYWTLRNKSTKYAEKLISVINTRIETIEKNNKIGKLTDFKDTRAIALGHFSIFYKITPTKIIITAFWDNRQNPKSLLRLISK